LKFADGPRLAVDLVVICAGVVPRDELARTAGLDVADQGGILVNEELQASDPRVYAIGDCARHRGTAYGLEGPARAMAAALARGLTGDKDRAFTRADASTILRFDGLGVASLGDPNLDSASSRSIVFSDLARGIYKKLVLSNDGKRLLGAILVGDTTQLSFLRDILVDRAPLPSTPEELLLRPAEPATRSAPSVPAEAVTT
jgi:nitrite reductase (NADH) large subunit